MFENVLRMSYAYLVVFQYKNYKYLRLFEIV